MPRPELLEDEIGRKLAEAHRNGELASTPGYGAPFEEDTGWAATPEALRMPFKILKDAGVVPYEVEMFNERARLRSALQRETEPLASREIQAKLSLLEQSISLRLQSIRSQC